MSNCILQPMKLRMIRHKFVDFGNKLILVTMYTHLFLSYIIYTFIEKANAGRTHIRARILHWSAQSATIANENHA